MNLEDKVYNYKTKYLYGFTQSELKQILEEYPDINMDKVENTLMRNTGRVIDDNFITYHCDVLTALRCDIENRDQYGYEFD